MKKWSLSTTVTHSHRSPGLYNVAYDGSGNYVEIRGGYGGVDIETNYNGGTPTTRQSNSTDTLDYGVVRYFDSKWWIAYSYFSGTTIYVVSRNSSDGTTWSAETVFIEDTTPDYDAYFVQDIGYVDGYLTLIFITKDGAIYKTWIAAYGTTLAGDLAQNGTGIIGFGFYDGSAYAVFRQVTPNGVITIRKYNAPGGTATYEDIATINTPDYTYEVNFNPYYLIWHTPYTWFLYSTNDSKIWLIKDNRTIWKAQLLLLKKASINFNEDYTVQSITTLNTTTTRYVYKVYYGGGLCRISASGTYTASALPYGTQRNAALDVSGDEVTGAVTEYVTDTTLKVYQSKNNFNVLDNNPTLEIINVENATLETQYDIADDNGRTLFAGYKYSGSEKPDDFASATYVSFISRDLQRLISHQDTLTWANHLIDIIRRQCLYLNPTSITSSADLFAVTYRYQILSEILKDVSKGDSKYVSIDPDAIVRLNDGSADSGVTFTTEIRGNLNKDSIDANIGRVILNDQVVAVSTTVDGGDYIDYYPAINDIDQLTVIGDNILDTQKLNRILLLVKTSNVPYIGKYYTITVAELSITAETWICYGYQYSYPDDAMQIYFVDALYIESRGSTAPNAYIAEAIIEGMLPCKALLVNNEGNFKNQYADKWGTSGTPISWSENASPTTFEVVNSYSNHNYPIHLIADSSSDGMTRNLTGSRLYVSFWINMRQTDKQIWLAYRYDGTYYEFGIQFGTSADISVRDAAGSGWTATSVKYDTNWHHYFIDYSKNGTIRYYMDGTQIAAISSTCNRDATTLNMFVYVSTSGEWYFDAFYAGASWQEAWSNFADGLMIDRFQFTQYGPIGYHSLQILDGSSWDAYYQQSTTNNVSVDLNFTTGASANKNAAITESIAPQLRVPPNTKCIDLLIECKIETSTNIANYVLIRRNGNSNTIMGLKQYFQQTTNASINTRGNVELDKDGWCELIFTWAAGLEKIYIKVMGYTI